MNARFEPPVSELDLVLACIKHFLRTHSTIPRVKKESDWQYFLALLDNHRVLPIVHYELVKHDLLESIPEDIRQHFSSRLQRATQRNLRLTAGLLKILSYFYAADIRVLPLKGTSLSSALYGDQNLRMPGDIDLLIECKFYPKAKEILQSLGYQFQDPEIASWDVWQEQAYLQQQGEITWFHPEDNTVVDLHIRWTRHPCGLQLGFDEAWSTSLLISEQNHQNIRVLSPENQVLYLSAHGAKHQWLRLLWLTDLAILVQQSEKFQLDWEQILIKAQKFGVSRPVGQGLRLANQTLTLKIPKSWENFCQTKSVGSLMKIALPAILDLESEPVADTIRVSPKAGTGGATSPSPRKIFTMLRYEMALQGGWGYKLQCISRFAFTANDWKLVRLPASLWFLYFPLRPFLYCYRQWRNRKS